MPPVMSSTPLTTRPSFASRDRCKMHTWPRHLACELVRPGQTQTCRGDQASPRLSTGGSYCCPRHPAPRPPTASSSCHPYANPVRGRHFYCFSGLILLKFFFFFAQVIPTPLERQINSCSLRNSPLSFLLLPRQGKCPIPVRLWQRLPEKAAIICPSAHLHLYTGTSYSTDGWQSRASKAT